ncbi:hypothetical protein [Streptomyces poriferorum]|uniref:Uncharacterized protein n=1 Tax=Streptomyces poriferorum TaxID=2798799 RepID=A0ABY9J2U3_9ACTN|nr:MULTISPECIES: hypothetical protein [unclassified Streptomyces]MDP5309434.1 hypothetical protein [Streptomyces sp. Alt4]WLQ61369.1 hypothetical protein P8A19_40790 [Streptomyces sp. Alt2]
MFTAVHDAWWAQARKVHGGRDGTRALGEVLLLNRHLAHEHVVAGLATAPQAGALTADAVALEAHKVAQAEDEPTIGASHPGGPEADAGHRHLAARVAARPPSTGHQTAAVGAPLRPTAPTPPHQRQRPP